MKVIDATDWLRQRTNTIEERRLRSEGLTDQDHRGRDSSLRSRAFHFRRDRDGKAIKRRKA